MKIKGATRVKVSKIEEKTDTRSLVYFMSTRKNEKDEFVNSLFMGWFVGDAKKKLPELKSILDRLEKWDDGGVKSPVAIFLTEFQIIKEKYIKEGKTTYPISITVFNWEFRESTQKALENPVEIPDAGEDII
jgi:hypothetical protein